MPLDDAESLSRHIQQHKKAVQDFVTAAQQLGTDKDAASRDRIKRLRTTIQQLEAKVDEILKSRGNDPAAAHDEAWEQLKQKYQQARREFESANMAAKKKERMNAATAGPANDRDSGTGNRPAAAPGAAAGGDVRVQEFKRIDDSELTTKEHLETEKLRSAIDIENEMRDLKATYQEFNDLVHHQQTGLDRASTNISEARVHVEKGIVELQDASKHQKSSRKKLCIIVVVLLVVAIAIGVVVYLATR